MKPLKRAFFFIFLFFVAKSYSQSNCVDWDAWRYPKIIGGKSYSWNGAAWNVPNPVQAKVQLPKLDDDNYYRGMLEYKPSSYNSGNSTQHPLIIFFHGSAACGNGTNADLCRIYKDTAQDLATHKALPGLIEHNLTVRNWLDANNYIVVSPQSTIYRRNYPENAYPNLFPKPVNVDNLINYLLNTRYPNKIDLRRIYLVGYSSGANTIMEYVGSSTQRAGRIAAVMPISLCSQLYHFSNVDMGVNAQNISSARLHTWFVYCRTDNCGYGPALNVSKTWVDAINATGGETPRLTTLTEVAAPGLYKCSDSLVHDAWSRAFDLNFVASFTGDGNSSNPNDGINKNSYNWFSSTINAVLPVTLKSYSARLVNNKVILEWTTTDEKNNSHFTIERAGEDQKFAEIGTVSGARDNVGEKDYSFTDNNPLGGLGFYRLVQSDIDGKKTYLEIKRILNRQGLKNDAVIYPNPFASDISAVIALQKSQKLTLTLTDMSGHVVSKINGMYAQGSSEVRIPASSLAKGIYFLKIEGMDFSSTKKIVKQ